MAITKERKIELVAHYKELLGNTTGIIVTEYRALSVAQVGDLRTKLREQQGRYVITKNTLFMIALREMGWPIPESLLVGTVGVALGNGNFPAVAKILLGWVKDNPDFMSVKGGVLAGQIISADQVEMVSSLPPLETLRAQLAGLIAQPAVGLVSVINAGAAALPSVLQAYVDKHEQGDAAA